MSIRDEVRDAPEYVFRAHPYRIKLDQNEAPEDLSDGVRRKALERIARADWHRYPDLRAAGIAERIGRRDEWDADGVVVAPGSNVLIQALVIAAGIGRRVLTVAPTFAVYASQARLLGVPLRELPLRQPGFGLDVGGLEAELEQGPGVLFLADPAAPTGNRLDDVALATVLDAASHFGWTAVVDEAYAPFDERDRSSWVAGRRDRVLLRTFSKADALGGVRLGYALTHPDTARNLGKVLLPFNLSALQTAVAEVVLDDPDAMRERQRRIERTRSERERIREHLADRDDVTVYPSVTNFLLFRVSDAARLHADLLDHGVLIRRQDHLPGLDGCMRVTIGSPEQNDAFLEAFDTVMRVDVDRPTDRVRGHAHG